MITAQQARKLTNDRQKIKMQNELRDVFQMIRATANEGGYSVDFYQSQEVVIYGLIKTYRKFLEEIGYRVQLDYDQVEGNTYRVEW